MRTPVPDPDSPHQTESPCLRLNPCPHPLLAGLLLLCMHTERMQMSSNIMINIFCSVSCIIVPFGGDDGDPLPPGGVEAGMRRRRAAAAAAAGYG